MAAIPTPHISRDLVVRAAAGLRPFRPAGFRVDVEQVGGRTVIHNYGHGGSGLTLAPGTARRAADLAVAHGRRGEHVAVLGAGAVGLCTARTLQQRGFRVTVHAAARSPRTTSNVAGGLWGTFTLVDEAYATPDYGHRLASICRDSHAYFAALDGARYGVRPITLYLVGDAAALPWEMALTPELFPTTALGRHEHPFSARSVLRTTTFMIEPERFLGALEEDIEADGGAFTSGELTSVDDVVALEPGLIANCLGLAAGRLFGDASVVPIKGELALLASQPGIDYAVISLDDDAYLLPRQTALVVGGSRVPGELSPEPREAEIDLILTRARALFR